MIKLSVILVLYNEFELVKTMLASIYENEVSGMEVIISDNSSIKNGYKTILKKFPKVKHFANKEDLGFGAGVNAGAKHAKGEFLLLLTPDMYLLPKTIKETITYIESHSDVGVVGCQLFASPGKQELSAAKDYPGFLTQLFFYNIPFYKLFSFIKKDYVPMFYSKQMHKKVIQAKAVRGEYMIIRKKAFDEVKGFDKQFFLYFEDIDLCKRIRDRGWKIVYIPEGGIVQNGISAWKKTKITQALPEFMKSSYLFFRKTYGRPHAMVVWLMTVLSVLISIPYLFLVGLSKSLFGKSSQSKDLLPLWVQILKWQITKGYKIVSS